MPWTADIVGFVDFRERAVDYAIAHPFSLDPLCLFLVAVEEVAADRQLRAEVGAEVFLGLHDHEDLEGVLVPDLVQRTVAEGVLGAATFAF